MNQNPGKQLLDTALYLAELGSERQVIDPIMDTVRQVTATHDPAKPYSDIEIAKLQGVYERLRNYLLTQDPVRRFNAAELDASIAKNREGDSSLLQRAPYLPLVLVGVMGAIFAVVAMLLPFAPAVRVQVAFAFVWIALHLGILWLYLSALRNFTPSLKRAYLLIVTGVSVTGIGIITTTFTEAFEWDKHFVLFTYGGPFVIYAIAMTYFYAGLRLFARQVGLNSFWLSWRNILLISGLITGFSIGAGLFLERIHPNVFAFTLWSILSLIFYAAVASGVAFKVAGNVTAKYAGSLKLLGFCLAGTALATFQYAPVLLLVPDAYRGGFWDITIPPIFVVTELLNLGAAYLFYRRSLQS